MSVPNTRRDVPESPSVPLLILPNALSISSIHNTQGDIASANCIICRMRFSLSPTIPPNNLPTSKRNNGKRHSWAIVLADNDLPVPWIPTNKTPLGLGIP